jgi:antitoxin (DNA-binding transcriptional repressor) of toxin-antitoxin stability system
MATRTISVADAVRDFEAVLARVQAGETFVIEKKRRPVAVVAAPQPKARPISEVIATFKRAEAAMCEVPVLDPEFADVVQERIRNRKPRDISRWA